MEIPNDIQPAGRGKSKKIIFGILTLLIVAAVVVVAVKLARNRHSEPAKQSASPKIQPVDLTQVSNYQTLLKKYKLQLSSAQETFLAQNRFVLVDASKSNLDFSGPLYNDEMLALFDQLGGNNDMYKRTAGDNVLVTPDVVLHAYHKFFDIALKEVEKEQLNDQLKIFTEALYGNAQAQVQSHSGQAQQHYQKILAQILVAKVLLENQAPAKPDYFETPEAESAYLKLDSNDTDSNAEIILAKYDKDLPANLQTAAREELKNIYEAKIVASSALFGSYNPEIPTDYTQYSPRSHYTESSQLRAYFRTMMYFGRNAYFFKTNDGLIDAALVATMFNQVSASGVKPVDAWQKISTITGFFVGQNDDITFTELSPWLNKILANNPATIADADNDAANSLAANVWQLPSPKILSDEIVSDNIASKDKNDLLRDTKGFRIFGQKFTFDAWLYSQLTAGQEKTDPKLPSTPSALFVPAAFGSNQAVGYVKEFLKTDAGFSDAQVDAFLVKLNEQKQTLDTVDSQQWNGALGTAWLKLLSTLTATYDNKYPAYMQSEYFPLKQLQTFLGSYTELKHDTLLYAKQSYAELGGGGDDDSVLPPVVKGLVEPNVKFWQQLGDTVALTQKVFSENNLDQTRVAPRLAEFKKQVDFFAQMADKELNGQAISDDDYEKLRTTHLSYMSVPVDNVDLSDLKLRRSALVADVHTDTLRGQILYEGTGRPYLMLALAGEGNDLRLTAGIAFNHYEFTDKLGGNRISDQDWQTKVYENPSALPAKNFWYKSLLPE